MRKLLISRLFSANLYTVLASFYTVNANYYTVLASFYTVHANYYTVHANLYTVHASFYTVHANLYTVLANSNTVKGNNSIKTFAIRAFFRKKRRERGNLSVKMDSRFRGNDSGEGGNLSARIGRRRRRESGGGGKNRTAAGEIPIYIGMVKIGKEFTIPANAGISAGDSDLHRNGKSWKLGSLKFPHIFFAKNGVNAGICRRKWIPAFAGMTR